MANVKRFKKGNPGRPKGAKNHFTSIREDFLAIWNQVNGKALLAAYIVSKPDRIMKFAELIARLLPPESGGTSAPPGQSVQVIVYHPNSRAHDNGNRSPGASVSLPEVAR